MGGAEEVGDPTLEANPNRWAGNRWDGGEHKEKQPSEVKGVWPWEAWSIGERERG